MGSNKMDNITEFFKLLVEWGGAFKVADDLFIKYADDTPLEIELGKSTLPLMVFHDNMTSGKHTFFNPLVEPIGHSEERAWFFTSRSMILGNLIKRMMITLVEQSIGNEDMDFDTLDLVKPFAKKLDAKLITEIQAVPAINMLRILYNKRRRTAMVQTDMFDEDFIETHKMRKRSWGVIQGLLQSIVGTDEIESTFVYKSNKIGLQETDAYLNVMVKISMAIGEYVHLLLGKNLFTAELEQHLEQIDSYRKACNWASTGTVQHDKAIVKEERSRPKPWMRQDTLETAPTPGFIVQDPVIAPHSVANNDPGKFARMAQALAQNPWMDANQILAQPANPMMPGGMPGQPQMLDPYGMHQQQMPMYGAPQSAFAPTFEVHEQETDGIHLPKLNI